MTDERYSSLSTVQREHHDVAQSIQGWFATHEFKAAYHERFPQRGDSSMLPSDYCINRENKGNVSHPRFLEWDEAHRYKFVGLSEPEASQSSTTLGGGGGQVEARVDAWQGPAVDSQQRAACVSRFAVTETELVADGFSRAGHLSEFEPKQWPAPGVYFLIEELPSGELIKIYVGKGASMNGGVGRRIRDYLIHPVSNLDDGKVQDFVAYFEEVHDQSARLSIWIKRTAIDQATHEEGVAIAKHRPWINDVRTGLSPEVLSAHRRTRWDAWSKRLDE